MSHRLSIDSPRVKQFLQVYKQSDFNDVQADYGWHIHASFTNYFGSVFSELVDYSTPSGTLKIENTFIATGTEICGFSPRRTFSGYEVNDLQIPVTPGQEYNVSFDVKWTTDFDWGNTTPWTGTGTPIVKAGLIFGYNIPYTDPEIPFGDVPLSLDSYNINSSVNFSETWVSVEQTWTAPESATFCVPVIMIEQNGSSAVWFVEFDNFYVSETTWVNTITPDRVDGTAVTGSVNYSEVTDYDQPLQGWSTGLLGGDGLKIERDDTTVFNNAPSAKITFDWSTTYNQVSYLIHEIPDAVLGEIVTVSFWWKASAGVDGNIFLDLSLATANKVTGEYAGGATAMNSSGEAYGSFGELFYPDADTDWTELKCYFKVPPDFNPSEKIAQIVLSFTYQAPVTLWLNEIKLFKGANSYPSNYLSTVSTGTVLTTTGNLLGIEDRTIARANIGAVSSSDISDAISGVVTGDVVEVALTPNPYYVLSHSITVITAASTTFSLYLPRLSDIPDRAQYVVINKYPPYGLYAVNVMINSNDQSAGYKINSTLTQVTVNPKDTTVFIRSGNSWITYLDNSDYIRMYSSETSGGFDSTSTEPSLGYTTSRLNYNGVLHATGFHVHNYTNSAAVNYFVETGGQNEGIITKKTLANVKTEVVTTAAVNAAADAGLYDSGYHRTFKPGGGYRITTNNVDTGAIKIILPAAAVGSNHMLRIVVKFFDYAVGESFDVHIGGYWWAGASPPATGNWSNNPTAWIVGDPSVDRDFTIRLGRQADNSGVIYIGELASTWNYLQIYVTEVHQGNAAPLVGYTTGWSTGFETSAFENVTATITTNQVGRVAPTAAVGTNTTQIATTAFVNSEIVEDATAAVVKVQSSAPSNPYIGQVWVDSDSTPTGLSAIPIAAVDIASGAVTPTKESGGFVSKTATYTVDVDDRYVECTANSFTLNLHTAVGYAGRRHDILNTGAGTITVDANSTETIAGNLTVAVNTATTLAIVSNGTNWLIL